jgi:uncharacterized protein (DUF433 family)
MAAIERVEISPNVILGKPVIRVARTPVELILCKLAEGSLEEGLLDAHPRLTHEDIRATIASAAAVVANEKNLPLRSAVRQPSNLKTCSHSKSLEPLRDQVPNYDD